MTQLKDSTEEQNKSPEIVVTKERIIKSHDDLASANQKKAGSSGSKFLVVAIMLILIIINFFGFITWSVIKIRSSEIDNISNLIGKTQQSDRNMYMVAKFLQIYENLYSDSEVENMTQQEVLLNRTTDFDITQQTKEKEEFLFEPFVKEIIKLIDGLLGIESNVVSNSRASELLVRSYMEERNRNYSVAITLFTEFLEKNPNLGSSIKADVYLHLAFNNAILNNFDEARKNFEKVYKLSDKTSDVFITAIKIQEMMDMIEEEQKRNQKRIEKLKELEKSGTIDLEKIISTYNTLLNTNDTDGIISIAPGFIKSNQDKIDSNNSGISTNEDWKIAISAVYYYWGMALEKVGGKENISEAMNKYRKTIEIGIENRDNKYSKVNQAFERLQLNKEYYGYEIESETTEENEVFKELEEETKDSGLIALINETKREMTTKKTVKK